MKHILVLIGFVGSATFALPWTATAQQLQPKPGFTEKRERVLCGRMGCEAKTFYARPGCRRVQTGGWVGLPGAFKVVCGEKQ
jgi:hypothetical protein